MTWEPLLPAWLMLVLLALAVASAVIAYRRASLPAWLRATALVVVFAVMAGPEQVVPAATTAPPRLALVEDDSASMAVGDAGEAGSAASRNDAASAALAGIEHDLAGRYRIERYRLAAHLVAGAGDPGAAPAGGTSFDELARLAADPPAAIVLASDGGDFGNVPPEDALAAAQVPVYCLGVGSDAPACNAALSLEAASPTAFPGQEVGITAVVAASGACIGRSAHLTISGGDGTQVATRVLTLAGPETRAEFSLPVGTRAGECRWRARLDPLPGEVTAADNQAAVTVQVVDRALHLLVIEGQPYWDTTFAVRAWRGDRQLAVSALYALGTRRYRSGPAAPAGPLTAEDLAAADVVVLGAHPEVLLDPAQFALIARYVDQGGGLLLLGVDGLGDGPLAAIDPMLRRAGRSPNTIARLTEAGRALALLPGDEGAGLAAVVAGHSSGTRARAEILLGTAEQPLVAVRRAGAGQVAAVDAEGLWRWSMDQDGTAAERFWRQLAKAIARATDPGLQADKAAYRTGEQAVIATHDPAALAVADPAGGHASLMPADGVARLDLPGAGDYVLTQGGRTLTLGVAEDVREQVSCERRDDRLARLAEATGGALFGVRDAHALADRLGRRADLLVPGERRISLVASPLWLLALAALLGSEWWLRRRRHGVL